MKTSKKIVVLAAIGLVLVAGFGGLLHSKLFFRWVINNQAEARAAEYFKSFDFISYDFHSPDQVNFRDADLVLDTPQGKAVLHFPILSVRLMNGWVAADKKFEIATDNATASIPPATVSGLKADLRMDLKKEGRIRLGGQIEADSLQVPANKITLTRVDVLLQALNFKDGKLQDARGRLAISQAAYDQYKVQQIFADLRADEKIINLVDMSAQAYGGEVQGQISLEYLSGMAYSIQLNLSQIDLSQMRSANEAVFSQVAGKLQGKAGIQGSLKGITGIQSDLDIPTGGKINAAWLQAVVNYIPQSTQKKELEGLISRGEPVPVEKASLTLRNLSLEKLSTVIVLKSQTLNLDINLTVDINVEGGLDQLLKSSQVLTNQ